MKFKTKNFSCDIEKYQLNDKSFTIKFYNKEKEHSEDQICDYVLVDPRYGYMSLKFIGEDALLSRFLAENVFTDDIILEAIGFVESLSPHASNAYIPYNIMKVKISGTIEYNGEF